MRKLTTALLAAAAVSTAAFAEGSTNANGFYLGANAGIANTNVKYDFQNLNLVAVGTNLPGSDYAQTTKFDSGKMAGLFGAFAGYGMTVGQGAYFGGELYAGFDTSKVTPYDDSASGKRIGYWKTTVKRSNYYGLAARLGYMMTPSTLAYVRLAIESGKWKAEVAPNGGTIDTQKSSTATAAEIANAKKTVSKSKSGISFAPGIGMEAYITKNMFVRAEYSYLFGPKLTMEQDIKALGNGFINGDTVKHNFKITQHQFKIGVGYKF